MKIPTGKTEEEVLDIIEKIVSRLASRYKFGYFDIDDIKQEARIHAISKLKKYNTKRGPLENFLSRAIKNFLFNLRRNKFSRPESKLKEASEKQKQRNTSKKNLMEPLDLGSVDMNEESRMYYEVDEVERLTLKEINDVVEAELDVSLRKDFLTWKAGMTVEKNRRKKMLTRVAAILMEKRIDVGDLVTRIEDL